MRSERSTPTRRRAYGAISGPHSPVPQPASSTSSCFAASGSVSASTAATSAGARYWSLASFASKLAAKLSNVASMNASDARAGTSRPEQAASMCNAIGSSGSSRSHSSKISTALSTSPRVQCASASSLRASGCFGRSVITLEKHTAASLARCWPFRRMPRLWYASACSGSILIAARYAASASTALPVARSTTPRLLCAFACSGSSSIARRYAAIAASSSSPSCRTIPRLLCQSARSGSSSRLRSISETASPRRAC